jgi:O-antigen/teichoic acid export membrane protein
MSISLTAPLTFVKGLINRGHSRSVNAKKNIFALLLIRGCSMSIGFILAPLTIHYVNPAQYGMWLTLIAVVGWFSLFDIGFGNGLRNRFTEAIAKGEDELARIYVSTTYAILVLIIALVLILFFSINPILNWAKILNAPTSMATELSHLATIILVFFCLQFVLQLITTIMIADQQPAKASFFNLLGSLFSFIVIIILTKTTPGNLIYMATAFSVTPVLVLTVSSIWFYSHKYRKYAPSFKYVKFSYVRNLMNLGIIFFVIQIGALVLFQTDNIVATQLFGPKEVTTFGLAYKLFSMNMVVFSIVMAPLWSAFTDAYTKHDFVWIKYLFIKVQKVWLILFCCSIVLLLVSPFVFKLWIGNRVQIPFKLSVAMTLYTVAQTWLLIPCYLLNGIGKIKMQFYLYIICILTNIPISILLGKLIGLPGIALSNLITYIFMGIILTLQCKKIINNKATGIWLR